MALPYQPKTKTCACGYTGKFFGKKCGLCRKKARNAKQRENYKPTGELELFRQIWETRPHCSEVSGKPLGSFNVSYFSHILAKGRCKAARLDPDNIVLKTIEEHNTWEHARHTLKDNPKWRWVFERLQHMKQKYNAF